MANKTVTNIKIKQVVKTTAEWALVDSVIESGILCVEVKTNGDTMIKIGDGVKTFAELDYIKANSDQYDLPAATTSSLGGVIVGNGLSVVTTPGATEGTISVDEMTGAVAPDPEDPEDQGTDGTAGAVPAPDAGDTGKFLRGDGTWAVPADTNTTYGVSGEVAASGTNVGKYVVTLTDSNSNTTEAVIDQFEGATQAAAGSTGLVPAPTSGSTDKYLKSDGTWDDTVLTTGDVITLNCTI